MPSSMYATLALLSVACGLLVACGPAPTAIPKATIERPVGSSDPQTRSAAPTVAGPHVVGSQPAPSIELVERLDDPAPGTDEAPELVIAFRYPDGRQVPIAGHARAYTAFRDGVALVDGERRLVLVSPSGTRRVLAMQAGAAPTRSPAGDLLYVAQHGTQAELHRLGVAGADDILATGFASAGVLAPQADGRVLFVAAKGGGVAGVWLADGDGARCLTNCELGRAPWGDAFVPTPGDPERLLVRGDRVQWEDAEGSRHSVSLAAPSQVPPASLPASGQPSSLERRP